MNWELINGTILTPDHVIQNGAITISNDKFLKVEKKPSNETKIQIDLNNLIVMPGFINGHDHLLGSYMPRVGDRKPYMNWLVWDNDLKSSPVYTERQQIEAKELYMLGGFRHLLCGVTSVQDHIPHFVQDMFKNNVPVRLVDKYAVAHSITSFALKWGDTVENEHKLAVENDIPFIAHCSEGYDQETIRSVQTLKEKNALSKNTVLIHGIAFSPDDIKLLAQNNCNVVWCPASNIYMFEKTAPIKELLDNSVNVCLGTDSPMSGSVNMFEELFIAKKYFEETYHTELNPKVLLNMLTKNPAKAFSLHNLGQIEPDFLADFIIVNGDKNNPYDTVTSMNYEDIMLVVINGKPVYGDESFIPLFDALGSSYQKIKVDSFKKIIEGDVLGLLDRIRASVGFHKELEFLPVEPW
jgi:cytosine/adenosine deaminase-related metal-dependent hydrolase